MAKGRVTLVACALLFMLLTVSFSGCLEQTPVNERPVVKIDYPNDGVTVSGIVIFSGTAFDPDGNDSLLTVEVKVDDGKWLEAYGDGNWSFELDTSLYGDGKHEFYTRAFDNVSYSENVELTFFVDNSDKFEDVHRWAVFVATANRPDVKVKLGNGGLTLAEEMASYFINNFGYPANHITILFDDGWVRANNGEGERVVTLQERPERLTGVSYGAATLDTVKSVLNSVVETANQYDDSEVFIWLFNHGVGDPENKLTGGKVLEHSEILVWDGVLSDYQLGDILNPLQAKLCLIVDACYSGGFANRVVFNLPTLLNSGLPEKGRIVITGASKFTTGYASTVTGPLFTQLWFNGIKTGQADGFRKGVFEKGRATHLRFFKDGKVSVEEAFYFARYMLTTKEFKDYRSMQPQMNDRYPGNPPVGNRGEMFLGT